MPLLEASRASFFIILRLREKLGLALLIGLLLFSQTTMAVHEADHSFHQDSFACDQFLASDLNESHTGGDPALLTHFVIDNNRQFKGPSSITLSRPYQLRPVRAPPSFH